MKAWALTEGDLFTIDRNSRQEVYEMLGTILDDKDGIIDIRCIVRLQMTGLGWRMVKDHYIEQPQRGKGSGSGRKKPRVISLETVCNPYAYVTKIEIPSSVR